MFITCGQFGVIIEIFLEFRHTFKVSKSLLLELYDHTLEVRVWNSKSKLSARARYDRPKAFRLPAPTAKKIPQSESEEQGREAGETNLPPLIRRPSKLPVVSHDRVRGGGYKAGQRLKQVCSSARLQYTYDTIADSASLFCVCTLILFPRLRDFLGIYFEPPGSSILTEH